MKCSDIQFELPLYSDGTLDDAANGSVREHIDACPVCRERLSELISVRTGLRQTAQPVLPVAMHRSIRDAVTAEARRGQRSWLPVPPDIRQWLQMQVMPYGVGGLASVVLAFGFLTLMFSGSLRPEPFTARRSGQTSIMLANNFDPYRVNSPDEISPSDFARSRLSVSGESPSVNPQGALIALTKSLVRGEMRDDEVVIVAEVFGNGLARISEVVEPSRDRHVVEELRKALESDPAYAPFVPSTVEDRPESVRVVFRLQSVNVSTRDRRGRARL